jgi:hypothetical protein
VIYKGDLKMQKDYREKYYHGKETIEEMLFRKGEILTKIDISKACAILMVGLLFGVVSIAIISEGELEGFGIFIAILSSITFLIGIIALTLYPIGLNMLERAELLYNTRVTHEKLQQIKRIYTHEAAPRSAPQGRGRSACDLRGRGAFGRGAYDSQI